MSRDGARLGDYLAHILEAIDRIARYTAGMDASSFAAIRWCRMRIRNLEVIGEASHNIETQCPEFAEAHPDRRDQSGPHRDLGREDATRWQHVGPGS